jgi:hypothetical protein
MFACPPCTARKLVWRRLGTAVCQAHPRRRQTGTAHRRVDQYHVDVDERMVGCPHAHHGLRRNGERTDLAPRLTWDQHTPK